MRGRATTHLKAGAHESLKCAQNVSRSKRMLHSTFWIHGAGILDLPPWATTMQPTDNDLPLKHKTAPLSPDSCSLGSHRPELHHDGVFLDFLYPPRALAYLHNIGGQQWERWEKRNSRRLPEGFISAPRGHSFRSYGKTAKRQEKHTYEPLGEGKGIANTSVKEAMRELQNDSPATNQRTNEGQLLAIGTSQGELSARSNEMKEGSTTYESEISPGELAEQGIGESVADPLKALRQLIGGRQRATRTDPTSQAWFLYNSLRDAEREDTDLKSHLLMFFGAQRNDVADAHTIALYYAIPTKDRSLPIYQAALGAYLRRKDFDFALGLHNEALNNIANGHQISKALFRHALEQDLWEVALDVQKHHHEMYGITGQQSQIAIFWLDVAEIPDLVKAAWRLHAKLLKWQRRQKPGLAPYWLMCAKLSEEAVLHFMRDPLPRAIPSKELHRLFSTIFRWSDNRTKVFEDALSSAIRHLKRRDDYAHAHHLISGLYLIYRQTGVKRAPPWMLSSLLHRVARYEAKLGVAKKASHTLTVHRLVADWSNDYGQLSVWAVHMLMSHFASLGRVDKLDQWFSYLENHYPSYEHQKEVFWTSIYVHALRNDTAKAAQAFEVVQRLAHANNDQAPGKCWSCLVFAYCRVDDLEGAYKTFQRLLDDGAKPTSWQMMPIAAMIARRGDVEGLESFMRQYDDLLEEKRGTEVMASYLQALVKSDQLRRAMEVLEHIVEQVRTGEMSGSLTRCFNILITAYGLRCNIHETMRLYRWMKTSEIPMDTHTYSALMQALVSRRQTEAAKLILYKTMPRAGIRPTALHYGIVIHGFRRQNGYKQALRVHKRMIDDNIKPSLASERAYIGTKAMLRRKDMLKSSGEAGPLQDIMAEIQDTLATNDGIESMVSAKGPSFGYNRNNPKASYMGSVMHMHATQGNFEAVAEMFRLYRSSDKGSEATQRADPMPTLTALMKALLTAGEYKQVEAYWKLAKQEADLIVAPIPVPDFTKTRVEAEEQSQALDSIGAKDVGSTQLADTELLNTGESVVTQNVAEQSTALHGPTPSPARRYILNYAFELYIDSLSRENRPQDLVRECTKLLHQGYRFYTRTWNRLIVHLCTASPPLVLLAFSLTERFLMPGFPGWYGRDEVVRKNVTKSSAYSGMQYMRRKYFAVNHLVPQYETLVHLAAAYIKLRRMEDMTGQGATREDAIQRLVGSVQEVRASAPRTLAAIESMPQTGDRIQRSLLGA